MEKLPLEPVVPPSSLTLQHKLVGHTDEVIATTWSPDGKRLASCARDWTVRVWDATTGMQLHTLEGHTSRVWCVAWSPDGTRLASCSSDNTVQVWDTMTGTQLHILEGHTSRVWCVAWSPDGTRLASCSNDSTVRVWDALTGTQLRTPKVHTEVLRVTWSLDGKRLASCSYDGTVRVWDAMEGTQLYRRDHKDAVLQVVWSPDGERLASCSHDGTIQVWNATTNMPLHTLKEHTNVVHDVEWSPDGQRLASCSYDGTVRIWDAITGLQLYQLDHTQVVLQVAWSPDGKFLISGSRNHPSNETEIRIWRTDTWEQLVVIDNLRSNGHLFAWNPHLPLLVTAGQQERDLSVWQLNSARDGHGIAELGQSIRDALNWTDLPSVESTKLLQVVKTFILHEKQAGQILRTADELYQGFILTPDAPAPDEVPQRQFEATLRQLATLGAIRYPGFGNMVLLQPERLDAYTSALLMTVKEEPNGQGYILEERVRQGRFAIPQEQLISNRKQEQLLLIAMIEELVRHELVLREGESLLFPAQLTSECPEYTALMKKHPIKFIFDGPILSIYTTLVVRLAQCGTFQKQNQWQNVVTYTTSLGGTYSLLLSPQADEQAELGLFFDKLAPEEMRMHFESFVHAHLNRHARGTVQRRWRIICPNCGKNFSNTQVKKRKENKFSFITCDNCNTSVSLLNGRERLGISSFSLVTTMEQTANIQRDRECAALKLDGQRLFTLATPPRRAD